MKTRIPELDGIRGLAIVLVLIVHFAGVRGLPEPLVEFINAGWAGVDLFFVLSGFLITGILLRSKDRPWREYLTVFYRNRALRIFPISYLFLIGCALFYAAPAWKYWVYALQLGNLLNVFGQAVQPIRHFWSLAIEEQFYMVWPLVVLWLSTRKLVRFCMAGIIFTVIARFAVVHFHLPAKEFVYALTPLRWDALLMGALIACLAHTGTLPRFAWSVKWIAMAGVALFAFGVTVGHGTQHFAPATARYEYLGVDLIFAALIASVALWSGSGWLRLARARPLRFFGKYSYAIYVFHFPLIAWIGNSIPLGYPPATRGLISLATGTVLSVVAALISWHLIEKRLGTRKAHFADSLKYSAHREAACHATAGAAR